MPDGDAPPDGVLYLHSPTYGTSDAPVFSDRPGLRRQA
jgi:hypothetical protein